MLCLEDPSASDILRSPCREELKAENDVLERTRSVALLLLCCRSSLRVEWLKMSPANSDKVVLEPNIPDIIDALEEIRFRWGNESCFEGARSRWLPCGPLKSLRPL